MAGINIEDEWWSDPRRFRLIEKVGSRELADGMAVQLWFFAFRFWTKKELIPEHAWAGAGFSDFFFECGLAEKRSEGIYVRGSSRHFGWYDKYVARAKKGGEARAKISKRNKNGCFKAESDPAKHQPEPAKHQPEPANASQDQPSYSYSYFTKDSSSNKDLTKEVIGTAAVVEKEKIKEQVHPVEILESGYRQDLGVYTDLLEQAFSPKRVPVFIKRKVSALAAVHQSADDFGVWLTGVINSKNCPRPEKDYEVFCRYVGSAIRSSINEA